MDLEKKSTIFPDFLLLKIWVINTRDNSDQYCLLDTRHLFQRHNHVRIYMIYILFSLYFHPQFMILETLHALLIHYFNKTSLSTSLKKGNLGHNWVLLKYVFFLQNFSNRTFACPGLVNPLQVTSEKSIHYMLQVYSQLIFWRCNGLIVHLYHVMG